MSVRCPSCRRQCPGGADQWVSCLMCGRRFYSVSGGEGTEISSRFEPPVRRERRPADPSGPALGYASLACAVFFPLLASAVGHFYPESGPALLVMSSMLAVVFGGAFGFGALKLSAGICKAYGALGMALAALQTAWLMAAILAYRL